MLFFLALHAQSLLCLIYSTLCSACCPTIPKPVLNMLLNGLIGVCFNSRLSLFEAACLMAHDYKQEATEIELEI